MCCWRGNRIGGMSGVVIRQVGQKKAIGSAGKGPYYSLIRKLLGRKGRAIGQAYLKLPKGHLFSSPNGCVRYAQPSFRVDCCMAAIREKNLDSRGSADVAERA